MLSDIRTALRVLRKQPRFTITAAITLAIGIGATTAIFSVVNGVLLKPLPYPDDDTLVDVLSTAPGLGYNQFGLSADIFFFYQSESRSFRSMALSAGRPVNLTGDGAPEQIAAVDTTYTYFDTLGIRPALGQSFHASDDVPAAPRVAIISDRLWRSHLVSRPDIVGRTIRIDDEPTMILGVMPTAIDQPNSADLWRPARLDRTHPPSGAFQWRAIARLNPDVSTAKAEAELTPLVKRFLDERIKDDQDYRNFLLNGQYRPLVKTMKETVVGDVRQPLWILLGTVGFVLLIACANVANLCLVRAEARQREIGIRAALGAGRGVLVRQALVEAVVLAGIGGALGFGLAALGMPALLSLAPESLPRVNAIRVDARVLAFAGLASLFAALVFGLVPAIRLSRTRAFEVLRQGGRGSTDGALRQRGRQMLVVAQTAMAVILLVGSGLLARSFAHMVRTDLGFNPDDVLTFRVSLPATSYKQGSDVSQFELRLSERLAQIPGVDSAGAVAVLPLAGSASGTSFVVEGHAVVPGQLPPMIHYKQITPGYFATMGMRLERGRTFGAIDDSANAHTVVVNRAMADKFWPKQEAIGRTVHVSGDDDIFSVIGVVNSERQNGIREEAPALIYFMPGSRGDAGLTRTLTYLVRGRAIAGRAAEVRAAVWELDPKLPIAVMQTLDEVVSASMVQFSFTMLTLGIAAGIALLLGAIGLYGVLSYTVSLRVREIGVRLALGAQPGRVMRSVVANGVILAAIGLVIGLAGAAALTRVLQGILFETTALDPITFVAMSAVMAVVALLASYLPARRAASVSPLESLRAE